MSKEMSVEEADKIMDKWNDLKSDLIFLQVIARKRTDFVFQDAIERVINTMNYHVEYSVKRYELDLKIRSKKEQKQS